MLSYVCYGFLGKHGYVWIHETIELEDDKENTIVYLNKVENESYSIIKGYKMFVYLAYY